MHSLLLLSFIFFSTIDGCHAFAIGRFAHGAAQHRSLEGSMSPTASHERRTLINSFTAPLPSDSIDLFTTLMTTETTKTNTLTVATPSISPSTRDENGPPRPQNSAAPSEPTGMTSQLLDDPLFIGIISIASVAGATIVVGVCLCLWFRRKRIRQEVLMQETKNADSRYFIPRRNLFPFPHLQRSEGSGQNATTIMVIPPMSPSPSSPSYERPSPALRLSPMVRQASGVLSDSDLGFAPRRSLYAPIPSARPDSPLLPAELQPPSPTQALTPAKYSQEMQGMQGPSENQAESPHRRKSEDHRLFDSPRNPAFSSPWLDRKVNYSLPLHPPSSL